MLVERPKAFIPTEDQGYLIVAIQTPDGTGREADRADRADRSARSRRRLEGVSDVVLLEGYNVLNATNQTNSATAFVILEGMVRAQRARAARHGAGAEAPGSDLRARSAAPSPWCSSRRRSGA